jgi:acetyltransferase-like isoleucine patch superfamily enzyme
MITWIRGLFVKLVFKLIPPEYFLEEFDRRRQQLKNKEVIIKTGSQFTRRAQVYNMRNDPSRIVIGQRSLIEAELLIFRYGGYIQVGDNTYIGRDSVVWSGEQVSIGNNVLISHNVNISDTSAHEVDHLERAERFKDFLTNGYPDNKASVTTAPIIIEDHVWINPYCVIIKGVTIGKGAIIGAGSVVTRDVDAFTMVAGNPAMFIKALPKTEEKL